MGGGSFLSLGLLILPVAATLGVLIGLDAYRSASGQAPLFPPGNGNGGLPGGGLGFGDDVLSSIYCQKAFGIHPNSKGQQYTLNPNQWGWEEGTPGSLCMNVTTFNNGSYATDATAPEWSITWQYPPGPETLPVHAFPNIKLDEDDAGLPVQLSEIVSMPIDAEWIYGVGDVVPTVLDEAALTANDVNANVAIDMFLDANKHKSQNSEDAKYEVMIWLGTFGSATKPLGWDAPVQLTESVAGATFQLYKGINEKGQTVLTWQSTAPVTNFNTDAASLLLDRISSVGGPASTDYLGYVALGSEALSSAVNVTLSVPRLSMAVNTK